MHPTRQIEVLLANRTQLSTTSETLSYTPYHIIISDITISRCESNMTEMMKEEGGNYTLVNRSGTAQLIPGHKGEGGG